ncbi:MAG: N-6 DNA methylase [Candidatus Helarchaeota archaeon]
MIPLTSQKFSEVFGVNSSIYYEYKNEISDLFRTNNNYIEIMSDKEQWTKKFSLLYKKSELNEDLFIKHSYISLLIKIIIAKKVLLFKKWTDLENFKNTLDEKKIDIFKDELFKWNIQINKINKMIFNEIDKYNFKSMDLFNLLYQEMFTIKTRRNLGEYYTPPELAKLMVDDSYKLGDYVLDPNCGSGTILIEIILKIIRSDIPDTDKIKYLNRIYGFDINPIAILIVKANLLLIYYLNNLRDTSINIFLLNPLFEKEYKGAQFPKFDLIIGNPPWIVLNSIHSYEYKEKIRMKALELGIIRGGKYSTSIEISSLIFEDVSQYFLKKGGIIFFIMTNGVMNGDQHSKFRTFKNFKEITIWKFTEDIFRINSICLKAKKGFRPILERLKINVIELFCIKKDSKWEFKFKRPEIYVPYNYNTISENSKIIRRFIPLKILELLLPQKKSEYSSKFYQGASLIPRNLIFINIDLEINEKLVKISPYMDFQAKYPWNKKPFDNAIIEKKYIFNVAKSTDLVPFKLLTTHYVVLPINKKDFKYEPKLLNKYAQIHFNFLNNYYKENIKEGTKIGKLWNEINHFNKLINPNQKRKIKIIFNGIGSIVKSAVLTNYELIDTSLYYYSTNNLDEAYYLMAVLNSPSITYSIQYFGSIGKSGTLRNIHKHPLNIPIPLYNPNNELCTKISNLGKKLEQLVQSLINEWIKEGNNKTFIKSQIKLRPRAIQLYILENKLFQKQLKYLDNLTKSLIFEG